MSFTPCVTHLDETITDHQRDMYHRPRIMLYGGALYKVNLYKQHTSSPETSLWH